MNDKVIPMNPDATPGVDIENRGLETPPAKAAAPAPMTADELRHKILEQFTKFQPHLAAYHEYAELIAALAVQYHSTRLVDEFKLPILEEVLLTTLDARETPKSLDAKLSQLAQIPDTKIKRVIFDRVKGVFYLFI
jgi:hypothetical protein